MSLIRGNMIPSLLTVFSGVIILMDYYLRLPYIPDLSGFLKNTSVIIVTIAMIMGVINVFSIHSHHLIKRTSGQWLYSLSLLIPMIVMMIAGLTPPIATHAAYQWLFNTIQNRVGQAVYSILAFFLASAAFRAFRARNLEALILLVSGFVIMLSSAPVGAAVLPAITPLGEWFQSVPNMGAQRGIILTVAVGAITLGIRLFLGREKAAGGL